MPISLGRAQRHVAEWTEQFRLLPPRQMWPKHLFHACQFDVAARILTLGELRCRNGAGELLCDVANQGALWNNPAAHDYARLYFRPRNSFHLKTEGIKRLGDLYRVDPHMSIPVILAFDLPRVMTLEGSGFLYGNFAHQGAQVLQGDAEFDTLDFAKIYHDGSTSQQDGDVIREARMSEVVVPGAVSTVLLNAVLCRTTHDAATLKHLLGGAVPNARIVVPQSASIFQRREMYITELYSDAGSVHLSLSFPHHGNLAGTKVRIYSDEGDKTYHLQRPKVVLGDLRAISPDTTWTIEIEDCIAYRAPIPWSSGLV